MYFCCDKNAEAPHTFYIFYISSVKVFLNQLLLFPTISAHELNGYLGFECYILQILSISKT